MRISSLDKKKLFYTLLTLVAWAVIYLFTQSKEYTSDGGARLILANAGPIHAFQYGDWGHFLQTPLAHEVAKTLRRLSVDVSGAQVFLALGFLGNLLGIFAFGLACERIFDSFTARLIGMVLFATSLVTWLYWNGETLNLGLGLAALALWAGVSGRVVLSAMFLGLAGACRMDFLSIAPGICFFAYQTKHHGKWNLKPFVLLVSSYGLMLLLSFSSTVLGFAFFIGKYASLGGLWAFINESREGYGAYTLAFGDVPIFKMIKGFVSAFTPAGHVLSDALKYRVQYSDFRQLFYFLSSAFILGVSAFLSGLATLRQPRIVAFAIGLFFAPQLLFNMRNLYQSEEYHAALLLGLLLILMSGLMFLFRSSRAKFLALAWVASVVLFAGVGVMLPLKTYGDRKYDRIDKLLALLRKDGANGVVVSCDELPVEIKSEGMKVISLVAVLQADQKIETLVDLQHKISRDLLRELAAGRHVFILGKRCQAEYLREYVPRLRDVFFGLATMSFGFLEPELNFVSTGIDGLPLPWTNQSDPISWRSVDVFELKRR